MITAIVSKKGGVGKTTTAVNLAAALADRGRRVLLVDLDSQASASLSLGLERGDLVPSIADALLGDTPVTETVRETTTPRLHLIPASVDLVRADAELGRFEHPTARLGRVLEPVERRYDFIFLDCPPSLSLLPASALRNAQAFLVPVVPQYLAVSGVRNLLSYAARIRRPDGGGPELLGLVLTMVDYRTRTTREHVDHLRQQLGRRVFGVEIRVNVRLAEAPSSGRPIFSYAPDAPGAHAYRLLSEEFLLRSAQLIRRTA